MKIVSVNIAKVADLFEAAAGGRKPVKTGIHKLPVVGQVRVGLLGIEGDEQADQSLHGGLDKAVYAYPIEHYDFWNVQCGASLKRPPGGLPLTAGAFGENLTILGLLESDVWIGDRLHVGDVVLQVTEPRHPCFKLNVKLNFSHASKVMVQSGFSGFYLRVVQPGSVSAGDAVTLVAGPREVALSWLNERRSKGRQESLF
ncbi:MAG: MOSC domain-containing protein [Pseudomonadota bacterium]